MSPFFISRKRALSAATLVLTLGTTACNSWNAGLLDAVPTPVRFKKENATAMDRSLAQAAAAWETWQANDRDPIALKAYRDAIGRTLTLMNAERPLNRWQEKWESQQFDFQVPDLHHAPAGTRQIRISEWNRIELTPSLTDPKAAPNPAISLIGIGAPVLLYRPWTKNRGAAPDGVSPNGSYRPATALLEFSGGNPRRVTLKFYSTRDQQEAVIAGKNRALAWDLDTPIKLQLSRGMFAKIGKMGLLRPDLNEQYSGLFRADAWDPNKIPVVFVHGLDSDPHIWEAAMDGIMADPVLRKRYQVWFFVYSTGAPVPGSAYRLRAALHEMKQSLDPGLRGAGMRNMILIGHSMGGLLTQMQVTDSGNALWDAYFQVPPEKVKIPADDLKAIRDRLFYRPVPWVKRAVFVCTPHRGSRLADLGIVGAMTKLIHAPQQLASLATHLNGDPSALNPQLKNFGGMMSNGVATLKPEHPYYPALASRPITVPFHSIIGDQGKGKGVNSSDGVVPFWSSHLKEAKSEVFVPGPHSSTSLPETVTEITRILRLHIGLPVPPPANHGALKETVPITKEVPAWAVDGGLNRKP